ncbi:MAG: VOC family protein, partial [Acidimicrobiales bacterium]
DPEGNEFCVLDSRAVYADAGVVAAIVVDSLEPPALAPFWVAATGWPIGRQAKAAVMLRDPDAAGPWLEFVRVDEAKRGKNRLHLDVAPFVGDDHGAEVVRLRALGATPADVGQGEVTWVVVADPEGNEFCVLSPR